MGKLKDAVMDAKKYNTLSDLQARIHQANRDAGWWDKERNIPELIALMHSELSEALEGVRRDLMDDHLPHRKMVEVEFADTIIRILDAAGGMGLDIEGAIMDKLEYNRHRLDHKRENRAAPGGKKF